MSIDRVATNMQVEDAFFEGINLKLAMDIKIKRTDGEQILSLIHYTRITRVGNERTVVDTHSGLSTCRQQLLTTVRHFRLSCRSSHSPWPHIRSHRCWFSLFVVVPSLPSRLFVRKSFFLNLHFTYVTKNCYSVLSSLVGFRTVSRWIVYKIASKYLMWSIAYTYIFIFSRHLEKWKTDDNL